MTSKDYKHKKQISQLSKHQIDAVVDIAITVQDIQQSLKKITIPQIAKNILGITKQGLHYKIGVRKEQHDK